MNTEKKVIAVLLTVSLLLVVGCSQPKAQTPREAMIRFSQSLYDNDKSLFLATIAEPEDPEFTEAMFDSLAPMAVFVKAFESEYGKDTLAEMSLQVNLPPSVEDIKSKATIQEEGDRATVSLPGMGEFLLIRKDGVWKVDFSREMPPAKEREAVIKAVEVIRQAAERVKKRIGKDSADEVAKDFVMSMMAASMGGG